MRPLLLWPTLFLAACQTAAPPPLGITAADCAASQARYEAEARALGYQGAALSAAAAFDPTGVASLGAMAVGRAQHAEFMARVQGEMAEQQAEDEAAFLRRWGMNPDGTPSGVPPEGDPAELLVPRC